MDRKNLKKLYKFRSLASCKEFCRVREMIKTGEFYFSDWENMNDPAEGYFRYDLNQENFAQEIANNKNKYKICSFASSWMSMLMWSHYADSHRGVCIEVEADESILIKEVNYEKTIPDMQKVLKDNNIEKAVEKILSTKTTLWKYENEKRAFKENAGMYKVGKITKVYFGIKREKYEQDLKRLCEDKKIPTQYLAINFNTNKMKIAPQT